MPNDDPKSIKRIAYDVGPLRDPAPTILERFLPMVDDALARCASNLPWEERDVVTIGMPHPTFGIMPMAMLVLTVRSPELAAKGPVLLGQPRVTGDGPPKIVLWESLPGWSLSQDAIDAVVRELVEKGHEARMQRAAGANGRGR